MFYKNHILFFCIYCLLFISILFAQDEDVFKDLSEGMEVDVVLKNGSRFRGNILSLTSDSIRLKINESGFTGEIAFEKNEVDMIIRIIPSIRFSESEENKKESEAESVKHKAEKTEEKEGVSEEDLLITFPPEDGWGREKLLEILKKSSDERTVEETLFVGNFDKWKNAFEKKEKKELLEKFPQDLWTEQKYFELKAKSEEELSDLEKEFLEKYSLWKKGVEELKKEKYEYLLKKFPPKEGWGEDKYIELKTKFIRLDILPTKDEQEFIDNYEIWKKAVEEEKKKEEEELIKKETEKREGEGEID